MSAIFVTPVFFKIIDNNILSSLLLCDFLKLGHSCLKIKMQTSTYIWFYHTRIQGISLLYHETSCLSRSAWFPEIKIIFLREVGLYMCLSSGKLFRMSWIAFMKLGDVNRYNVELLSCAPNKGLTSHLRSVQVKLLIIGVCVVKFRVGRRIVLQGTCL
jgi:hypothetical protein